MSDNTVLQSSEVQVAAILLTGGDSDDSLLGGEGNDSLSGGAGSDYLFGDLGSDILDGGAGADVLLGGDGDDALDGGEGDDVLDGGAGADSLIGGAGSDVLMDYEGNSMLDGGAGDDALFAGAGSDQLMGGSGDDYLSGGEGNDTYEGGAGNDTLADDSSTSSDTYRYNLGGGVDALADKGGSDVVQLGGGIAAATTTVRSNSLGQLVLSFSDGGALTLDNQYDAVSGAARVGDQVEQIVFGDGTVWNQARLRTLAVSGHSGADALYGFDGADAMSGGAGNDALWGRGGNDTLDGGAGDDQLFGGAGSDTLLGGAGADIYEGGAGGDYLFDYAVSNDLYNYKLGDGGDWLFDGGGVDTLQLGAGLAASATTVATNWGQLLIRFSDGGAVTLDAQYDADTGAVKTNQIEQIVFADGTVWNQQTLWSLSGLDKTIWGTSGSDTLLGGADVDHLSGAGGDDYLHGGAGADVLNGGEGADTLEGGTGNDELWDRSATSGDVYRYSLGDGQDVVYDLGGVDAVQLGGSITVGSVVVRGNQSGNLVLGFSDGGSLQMVGHFTGTASAPSSSQLESVIFADGTVWNQAQLRTLALTGGSGNDTIYGFATNDAMLGGAGNDVLYGFAGSDTLDGGAGADILIGGAGNDTYVLAQGGGADTVNENDGTAGNNDLLSIAAGVAADQLWFRQVGTSLEVSIIGTTDKATIANWYSGGTYHIEQFRTSDGKTLLDSQVQALVSAMAAFSPPAAGQTSLPADYLAALAPVLAANWT